MYEELETVLEAKRSGRMQHPDELLMMRIVAETLAKISETLASIGSIKAPEDDEL